MLAGGGSAHTDTHRCDLVSGLSQPRKTSVLVPAEKGYGGREGERNGQEVFQLRKRSVKAHCKHRNLLASLPEQRVLVAPLTFRLPDPSQSPFASFWTLHIPGTAKVYLEEKPLAAPGTAVPAPPAARAELPAAAPAKQEARRDALSFITP